MLKRKECSLYMISFEPNLKIWLAFAMILGLRLTAPCQQWNSLQLYGKNGYSVGKKIVADYMGNKYFLGHFQNDFYGEKKLEINCESLQTPAIGGRAINSFLIKYDAKNQVEWSRFVPGRAQDIAIDSAGNYFVVGYFEYVGFFGNEAIYPWGFEDGYVIKYDSLGEILWFKILTGSQFNTINTIKLWKENVIVSGINNDVAFFPPNTILPTGSFVLRISQSTSSVSAIKTFSSEEFWIYELDVDSFANVVIGGSFVNTINFGGATYSAGHWGKSFLAKLNKTLSEEWLKVLDEHVRIESLCANSGLYYIAGSFGGELKVGELVLANGNGDSFIIRIDSLGNSVKLLTSFGGAGVEIIYDIFVTDTTIYCTGSYTEPFQLQDASVTTNDGSDIFLAQFTLEGALVYILNSTGSKVDASDLIYIERGESIYVDQSGNLFLAGTIIDSEIFGTTKYPISGSSDAFLAAVASPGSPPSFKPHACFQEGKDLPVFPNPTKGIVNIPSNETVKDIKVYDMTGRKINFNDLMYSASQLNLTQLASGVYFIKVVTETGDYTSRIIKQ